jgi:hypothetical protein
VTTARGPAGARPDADTGRHREAALLRLSTGIAAAETEPDICEAVAAGLQDAALGFDFVAVLLVDEPTGDRVVVASRGSRTLASSPLSVAGPRSSRRCSTP